MACIYIQPFVKPTLQSAGRCNTEKNEIHITMRAMSARWGACTVHQPGGHRSEAIKQNLCYVSFCVQVCCREVGWQLPPAAAGLQCGVAPAHIWPGGQQRPHCPAALARPHWPAALARPHCPAAQLVGARVVHQRWSCKVPSVHLQGAVESAGNYQRSMLRSCGRGPPAVRKCTWQSMPVDRTKQTPKPVSAAPECPDAGPLHRWGCAAAGKIGQGTGAVAVKGPRGKHRAGAGKMPRASSGACTSH